MLDNSDSVKIIYLKNNDNMDAKTSERVPRAKSSTKQLEFHVAAVYEEITNMLQQRQHLTFELPTDVPTAVERVTLMKSVIANLLQQGVPSKSANLNKAKGGDESNIFQCQDCETYEKNLQKLQGEVRNHIRTHQQLRLYQDGLEEKIQEMKKEKKQSDKKLESIKKKYEQMKNIINSNMEKISKLETENQKLHKETRNYPKGQDSKRLTRYESNKENLSDWRNNQPHKTDRERGSVEKRPGSSERMRVSVNVRSTKGIPISSKIIQEKAKEEKAKALKNRIGFGF